MNVWEKIAELLLNLRRLSLNEAKIQESFKIWQ